MNSVEHRTGSITKSQVINLIDAATFACLNEMAFTRFLSFNFETLEQRPQVFISKFLKLASDWLRTKKVRCAYIWVLEKPPTKSLNCHILLHLPDRLAKDFARLERRWVRLAGAVWRKHFLCSQRIGVSKATPERIPSVGTLLVNIENVLSYMLKGADRDLCEQVGIEWISQGTILGKRVGTSQCIAKKARSSSGYQPRHSQRGSILFRDFYRLTCGCDKRA